MSLKHRNLHARRKHLSDWSPAEEGDNMFKSINVKEHKINSANGAHGWKCIQISVTREQCPSGFLTVRVPGLGAGLDVKPNWDENNYGILMFVVGKTEDKHFDKNDPTDKEVSNSLRMTQFLLDKLFAMLDQDRIVTRLTYVIPNGHFS